MTPRFDDPQLKIVHVASGREWRGGQRQVFLLARELSRHSELQSVVITGRGTELSRRLDAAGVRQHAVGWGPGLDPRVTLATLSAIAPGTIIHAHDNHAHALADLATRIRPAPIVVNRRLARPIRNARRYQRAAAVIAISEAVRGELLDARVPAIRIHVIPDAIDLSDAAEWRPWPDSLPAPDPDHALIACVAALTQEKGLLVLLDAAARLRVRHPTARWIVLGEGPMRTVLEQHRASLNLDDVVAFPGAIDQPEAVLSRATVAVQPSLSEGFGSSVLDALAVGVPVVASNTGGLPDALQAGGGVLVPAGDPASLALAVGRLLERPEERLALSAAARSGVRRFAIGSVVERTLDVYRSVMTIANGS